MLHLQDDQVCKQDAIHVDVMAASPEVECFSIIHRRVLRCVEDHSENHQCLKVSIKEPDPEFLHVEDEILHSDAVENRRVLQDLLLEFEVEQCVPDVVETREGDVVDLVDPLFVHSLTREHRPVAKHELDHHVKNILVEHEQDQFTIASVGFSAMNEQQSVEELKFADSKVRSSGRLHTFFASNANADMSFADHVAIVGAIANSQGHFLGVSDAHQSDDVALLLRAYTTANYDFHAITN